MLWRCKNIDEKGNTYLHSKTLIIDKFPLTHLWKTLKTSLIIFTNHNNLLKKAEYISLGN